MARYYRNPNPYSKTLDRKYLKYILYLVSVALGMALAFLVSKNLGWGSIILGCCVLFFFLKISDFITKLMGKNYRGSDGEREIRKVLEILPDDFAIFQNVPIKKHLDIDLVLIGPTGVFAIGVKSYRSFRLMGDGKDFIQETLAEAMGLKQYLKKSGIDIYIQAALVFSRAFVKYNLPLANSVSIIPKSSLLPLVERARRVEFDRVRAEEVIKNLYLK